MSVRDIALHEENEPGQTAPPGAVSHAPLKTADPLPVLTEMDFLQGGGAMGELVRAHDWSKTPLGPVSGWPQSLRTGISILLASQYPMLILWGREYVQIYNDAYRPVLGETKHPAALGQRASECWPEIWHMIGPMFDRVMDAAEPTWSEDLLFVLNRNGYMEETYFTFCYSAIREESGAVGGVLVTCVETTQRVLSERRLKTLRELAAQSSRSKTAKEACTIAAETLAENRHDIPFLLLYLIDHTKARLAGSIGLAEGVPECPFEIELTAGGEDAEIWPLSHVSSTGLPSVVKQLNNRFRDLPGGPWPESPNCAVILPVGIVGEGRAVAILVAGISPKRVLDDSYRGFLDLVAGQIGTAISNARSYEMERRRADSLAELDRAKTIFFSNVSHEFRTPLSLLLGPLEDIIRKDESSLQPEIVQQLKMAQRNAYRLQKLVNSLLDFSRIEAGRIRASYEPVELCSLTENLTSTFRSAIESAGLKLNVNCPSMSQPVYVDSDMWEKIVLNLISNAFKFTFEGEITVTLRETEDHVEFSVADTGSGIPESEIDRVFDRFHRVEGAKARTQEGTGIGLALVQELVRLHGGSTKVESAFGKGSTFTVSIPFGKDHLPVDRIHEASKHSSVPANSPAFIAEAERWLPEASNRAGRTERFVVQTQKPVTSAQTEDSKPRILIADDNADMRDYLRRLLSDSYNVRAVEDGEAALAEIKRSRPHLVLTDVMMPRLDGFGLLKAIRSDSAISSIPVIVLSARAGEESTIEGLEVGADDYLIKPFTARQLLARVAAHMETSRVRQKAADLERKRAEEATSAQQRITTILDSITDGFLAFDRNWNFTYINKAGRKLLREQGYASENLIGKNLWSTFPDLHGTEFEEQFLRASQRRTAVHFEAFYANFQRWFDVHAYPSDDGLTVYYQDVTQRQDTLRKLQESLTEKEVLLREIHHRVKNNLQIICSLLALQLGPCEDPNVRSMLKESQARVRSMALIHEKLYRSKNLAKIELASYVRDLAHELRRTYEISGTTIALNFSLEELWLPLDTAICCGLILQELISNSCKHAFRLKENGTIRISIEKQTDDNRFFCSVTDDGLGLPSEIDVDRSKSIGLRLVHLLVKQIDGSLEIRREGGTSFLLSLPLESGSSVSS